MEALVLVVFVAAVCVMFAFSYWWTRVCIRAYRHGWRRAFRGGRR